MVNWQEDATRCQGQAKFENTAAFVRRWEAAQLQGADMMAHCQAKDTHYQQAKECFHRTEEEGCLHQAEEELKRMLIAVPLCCDGCSSTLKCGRVGRGDVWHRWR